MDIQLHSGSQLYHLGFNRIPISTRIHYPFTRLRMCVTRSSSLPFPETKVGYYKELKAAVDAVERACRLCVHVKSSLLSNDKLVLEKSDQTPVTVADFGVQALISLELGKLFPSIPLVAEEDSSFLTKNNLVNLVVTEVADKSTLGDESLSETNVLEAIDRGGKDAYMFGAAPATYWVLDPIDGTKGFLKGNEALYVLIAIAQCLMLGFASPIVKRGIPYHSLLHSAQQPITIMLVTGKSISWLPAVEAGRASIFIQRNKAEKTIKAWDHAVGVICVHEAGGKVSDWAGSELNLAADQTERRIISPSGGILVSNGKLHNQILQLVES